MKSARALARAAGVLGAVLCAACAADPEAPPPEISVGTVDGTDAVLALVRGEGSVTLYVRGGVSSYATMTRWFEGPEEPSGAFSLESDGWTATADAGGESGRLRTPEGAELAFRARPAALDRIEGLYAAVDGGCRTGAVVFTPDDTDTPALQGTWCGAGDLYAQVTPIRPLSVLDRRGIEVQVELSGARKKLLVTPLVRP
ncbi:hypothetical protein [Sorangium atrum]|uniref:Secreted protein n=1 Tax=Sorangium atrum TaxID=2995308 RepID=A0ABT5CHL0_9BACT|nr:hypothetical protein [Sorangium aterium]MDC0685925.1 hypothetical protein [Sorangium aterium]